jgi:hypothetical protein
MNTKRYLLFIFSAVLVVALAGASVPGLAGELHPQRQVSSSCTEGSSIRQINEDGTVVCEANKGNQDSFIPQDNAIRTLVSDGVVGYYTSITVGSDGLGLISYNDYDNGAL